MKDKTLGEIGRDIGALCEEKNEAYGDSFAKAGKLIELLYPDGVKPEEYTDMLGIIRVIDKLFRIATKKDAFGESPWNDIAGYGILGVFNSQKSAKIERVFDEINAELRFIEHKALSHIDEHGFHLPDGSPIVDPGILGIDDAEVVGERSCQKCVYQANELDDMPCKKCIRQPYLPHFTEGTL